MKTTVVALGLLVACTLFVTAQQPNVRAAIEAANNQFAAAFQKGDAAAIAAMYTADAAAYPPNSEPVRGREGLEKLWKGAMAAGVKSVTLTIAEVEASGNTAHEVGAYEMRGDGGKVVDRGKYVVIWKREQGQWKLHRDIWNTSMPVGK